MSVPVQESVENKCTLIVFRQIEAGYQKIKAVLEGKQVKAAVTECNDAGPEGWTILVIATMTVVQ